MGAAAAQASLPWAGRGTGHRGGGSLKKRLLLIAVSEVWVRATCAIGATAVQLAPATPLRRRGVGTSHMRWRGGRGFTIDWLSNGQGWGALKVGAIADGLRLESQDSQSLFPGLGLSSRGAVYTWRDGRT